MHLGMMCIVLWMGLCEIKVLAQSVAWAPVQNSEMFVVFKCLTLLDEARAKLVVSKRPLINLHQIVSAFYVGKYCVNLQSEKQGTSLLQGMSA